MRRIYQCYFAFPDGRSAGYGGSGPFSTSEAVEQGKLILIINEIIVAETVWGLKSFYGHAGHKITRILY